MFTLLSTVSFDRRHRPRRHSPRTIHMPTRIVRTTLRDHCVAAFKVYAVVQFDVVIVFLLFVAREFYEDEDSSLNGALRGAPGLLRLQLYRNNGHRAQSSHEVYVMRLEPLIQRASALFFTDIEGIYTAEGAAVSEFWLAGAARYCL